MSLAGIEAVSLVSPTNVVVRPLPFQRTIAPGTKLEPTTSKLKAAPPAVVLEGEKEPTAGSGLLVTTVSSCVVPFATSGVVVLLAAAETERIVPLAVPAGT